MVRNRGYILCLPLNQTTRDSYMHISVYLWVACAMRMKRGGARQPCHSARYTECLNVVWSDLDDSESKDEDKVTLTGVFIGMKRGAILLSLQSIPGKICPRLSGIGLVLCRRKLTKTRTAGSDACYAYTCRKHSFMASLDRATSLHMLKQRPSCHAWRSNSLHASESFGRKQFV
jgi:hypothetical protein